MQIQWKKCFVKTGHFAINGNKCQPCHCYNRQFTCDNISSRITLLAQ